MFALGCHLFLREHEVANLTFADLVWTESVIQGGNIECILFLIAGKEEIGKKRLFLWRNRVNPELCPVNIFLLWMSLIKNRTTGTIFPRIRDLQRGTIQDHIRHAERADFRKHITYNAFDKALMHFIGELFPELRLTTHTMRKTSFFIALIGGADNLTIMVAARISSHDTMVKYLHDNRTKFERAKALGKEKEIRQLIDTYRAQRDLDSIKARDNAAEILQFDNILAVFHQKYPLTADPNQLSNAWQQIRNVNLIYNRLTEKLAKVQSYFQYILPDPSRYPMHADPLDISPLLHEV
ncbi:hypothetical protein HDU76_010750, partial [Blyttiomyces sp. JEL0837]